MIKKLINKMRHNHSSKETNSYRNENGFKNFVDDYVTYFDVRDLNF